MKVCWATKERDKALNYLAKFNERNYQMTEPLLRHLILTLADDPVDSTFADDMEAYYKTYKTLKKDNNWTAESDVYEAVALSFAEFGEADNALNVLRDLVEAGMHPSEKLCSKMLTKSLLVGNLEIVRVVGNWYLSNFDVRLEYGILCKMLEMAASTGDHQIGSIAFQMMQKFKYAPSAANYFNAIRSCLLKKDWIQATEILQQIHMQNYAETSAESSAGDSSPKVKLAFTAQQIESLKDLFCEIFIEYEDSKELDAVYFAMVDQVRSGRVVPTIVLDAIVEGFGKIDQTNRAFSTFQEYDALFHVKPDIHSYNSLLTSVASSQHINMQTMLSIFQDFDADPNNPSAVKCQPNSKSFSILYEAMADCGDLRVFDAVTKHMEEMQTETRSGRKVKGVVPSERSMRRIILAFGRKQTEADWAKVDQLKEKLIKQGNNQPLPTFFTDRLHWVEVQSKRRNVTVKTAGVVINDEENQDDGNGEENIDNIEGEEEEFQAQEDDEDVDLTEGYEEGSGVSEGEGEGEGEEEGEGEGEGEGEAAEAAEEGVEEMKVVGQGEGEGKEEEVKLELSSAESEVVADSPSPLGGDVRDQGFFGGTKW